MVITPRFREFGSNISPHHKHGLYRPYCLVSGNGISSIPDVVVIPP